ncbi:MAG: sulfotransferase [Steroidobacteraceae bacterium]
MTDDTASAPVELSADELIAEARRRTGLTDFGSSPPLLPALAVLVDALNREAGLSAAGVQARREGFIRALAHRLRIVDVLRRTPQIHDEPIAGPIVVLGLARSGTTKLQRMLAADDRLQSLALWKMMSPLRERDAGGRPNDAARLAFARTAVEAMRSRHPRFYAAHPMVAEEPDEEVFLMEMTFMGNLHVHGNQVPSYHDWLGTQSYEPWYRFLRELLQFFQWQDGAAGRPWLLKAPFHLGHLPLLSAEFPQATIVHCHRDPLVTMASTCGLVEASRCMHSARVDPLQIGRTAVRVWGGFIGRYMQDRPRLERCHRFVDLAYRRIVADASRCIDEVCSAAGLTLTAAAQAAMREWEQRNAQHKHGQHRYTLERYGIEPGEVNALFADYRQRFAPYLD